MKNKLNKIVLSIVVISIFLFSVSQVYAKTTGIDIIALARNKVLAIANIPTTQAIKELESNRAQVENDILGYIDNYIEGIDREIKEYTNQQKSLAQDRLDSNFNDIKAELDSARQGIVDEAKQQIKGIIDAKYQEEQNKLNNELPSKIEKKFK